MLKKVLSLVIRVAMVFSLFTVMLVMALVVGGMEVAAAGNGTYFINDDFESDEVGAIPEGWNKIYDAKNPGNQGVVDYVYQSGNKSFKLDGEWNESATYNKYLNIDDLPTNSIVEAYMRPASGDESGSISLFYTTDKKYLARVVFNGEQIGYSTNGDDNLQLWSDYLGELKKGNIHIAFIRVGNPGLQGLSLAKVTQRVSPATMIVFMSSVKSYALMAFEERASGYLLLPVKPGDLDEVVENIRKREQWRRDDLSY